MERTRTSGAFQPQLLPQSIPTPGLAKGSLHELSCSKLKDLIVHGVVVPKNTLEGMSAWRLV